MLQRETARLTLRPFQESDVETIYALVYADPEVRAHFTDFQGNVDGFRQRFQSRRNWKLINGFEYWALTRKVDGALLGLMGFQNHADEPMEWLLMPDGSRNVGRVPDCMDAELTYALGRAYWHQGYATEAGQALLRYGFQVVGIDRVINAISPDNDGSRALMVRLGFTFLDNGNPDDMIGLLENPDRGG